MKEAKILRDERGFNMETNQNEQKPLKEKVDELYDAWKNVKTKKIKIPRKAKVRKRKIKKGWIGILKIDENGNISGEKQKIAGFTYKTKDGLYHTSDGREILFWQGKFPIVLQPSWMINPIEIRKDIKNNETYGQPYVQARMMQDTIKTKKSFGKGLIWILIIGVIGYGIYYFFIKGG